MPGTHRTKTQESTIEAVKKAVTRTSQNGREELDHLLGTLADKVADVRGALASAKDEGIDHLGDGLDSVVKKTRKGVRALDRRWRRMNNPQRVALAGSLLAVLAAAAAAPTVARRIRERS
ncbi:MAG: hypothetical protein AB7G12_07255 [Thermoanaerobaculia bacterium]